MSKKHSVTKKSKSKKSKTIEELYKKKTHHEHILSLPDSYLGSVEPESQIMKIYNNEIDGIVKKEIVYVPGLYKIVDEILVNARDHSINDKTCKRIDVIIDKENNRITVKNNGNGIPVKMHKDHKMFVPELIFGHLLTSSHYDVKGKTTGGKNGYGAKITNIYSNEFCVETVDKKNKKKFYQKFTDNMYKKNKPVVTDLKGKIDPYTQISFVPDFSRFGIDGLSDDIINLFKKRVYDIAACTRPSVNVYYNNTKIKIKSFEEYIELYYKDKPISESQIIYEEMDRWKVGIVFNPDVGYDHMTFVNGICTYMGGNHVSHVLDIVINGLLKHIKQKHKNVNVKYSHIKDNMNVFIDSVITDPAFTSQSKEVLKTTTSSFGSKCELSDKFILSLAKTGIVDEVVNFAKIKELTALKKSDGKKRTNLKGLSKLEDAHWAAKNKSKQCRLILTEGDSAKTFAMSGLSVIGRDKYGVFPLKGKLLNVRDATVKKLASNEEIKNIKKIMGLKQGKKYTEENLIQLRYGGIIILTDQDVDGSHIKGLVINFIHHFWPSLLKIPGFIQSMATPIVKAFKTSDTKKQKPKIFYTLTDYDNWKKSGKSIGWKTKYYKGLGTSTDAEAKECFNEFEKSLISYLWKNGEEIDKEDKNDVENEDSDDSDDSDVSEAEDSNDSEKSKKNDDEEDDDYLDRHHPCYNSLTLAFEKKRANDRKDWLNNYDASNIIENNETQISYTDFVNKDLIHFSNYDNHRSIPALDGFKPSQRKVIFGSFKKKIDKNEIKVSRLSSYISEQTAYHHGEESLNGTIVGLAQNFVGSNNLNLLLPNGGFGTRREGGKDFASPRYIFTQLNKLSLRIFRQEDEYVLRYLEDDGDSIEPYMYAPIVPYILINGSEGIGTGYSTNIPCFNPLKIVEYLKCMMDDEDLPKIYPWYKNFKGKITKLNNNVYESTGCYEIKGSKTLVITELPVGSWTQKYREMLDDLVIDDPKKILKGQILQKYEDNSTNQDIHITLHFIHDGLQKLIKSNGIVNVLKLKKRISLTNMNMFDPSGKIVHYENVREIFDEFYGYRIDMYKKRKEYYIRLLENELLIRKYKMMYIQKIIDEEIILAKKSKEYVLQRCEDLEFPKLSYDIDAKEEDKSYDYLSRLLLFSLTSEKIAELQKERDDKEKELSDYKKKTVEEIWKGELDEFVGEYNVWLNEEKNNAKNLKKKSKKSKKSKIKKKNI